jgi:hypothetical protein
VIVEGRAPTGRGGRSSCRADGHTRDCAQFDAAIGGDLWKLIAREMHHEIE